jgi:beta-xylosidase
MSALFSPRRSSGAATALVALLVTSLAAPAAFPDVVGTQRIDDSFSGSTIDPNTWWFGTNNPNALAISQAEGHLTVNISGRAGNDFNASLGTRCRAHGNFDARISFDLSAWPAWPSSRAESP